MHPGQIDWSRIRLVAFDVDGTLYAQRPVRIRMAARLVLHCLTQADTKAISVLRTFRKEREKLADAEVAAFENVLVGTVAERHGVPREAVSRLVADWIDQRPLPLLGRFCYPGVARLFERLRRSGRAIGVLSDYPALAKLAAMGLDAEHVVSAGDVGLLKPHPRGLERLMEVAGVGGPETVLVGDRAERDGEAARRAGALCLLRSRKPVAEYVTFRSFDDAVFDGIDRPVIRPALG